MSNYCCTKKSLKADIPAYIAINNITLNTNISTQGSSSSNITDAWVYLNDNLIGIYQLPAKFPVLKEGTFNLKVYGGIKNNGISSTRARYLLYDAYQQQITLTPNETITVSPQVNYTSNAVFDWIEDFEGASLSFTYTSGSDTTINKTNSDVFEGVSSGRVYLTNSMNFFEMKSPIFTNIPKNGTKVYLEVNFKTNLPVLVGIYADLTQVALINLNTTSSWKKIYIDLTSAINNNKNATGYQVFFGIQETGLSPFPVDNPEFLLDNIKLVHF